MRRLAPLIAPFLASLVLGGCSGDPSATDPSEAASAPSSSGSPGQAPGEPEASEEPVPDTYADVEDPATVPLPPRVPGIRTLKAWKGSTIDDQGDQVAAELYLSAGRSLVLLPGSYEGAMARESSEAELENWRKYDVFTEGPTKVMDPVMVDGVEMLHARGTGPLGDVDWFVHATGERTVFLTFTMPTDLSESARERYLAQVLATLEFE